METHRIAGHMNPGTGDGAAPGGFSRRTALGALGTVLLVPLAACSASVEESSSPAANASASSAGSTAGSTSAAGTTEDEAIEMIAKRVAAHWPHMSTMWPGVDYTQHDVIVFTVDEEGKAKRAWLINTSEHRELTPEEYASVEVPPYFLATEFQGRRSLSMVLNLNHPLSGAPSAEDSFEQPEVPADPDPGVSFMYRLPTHELVHMYYQDGALQSAQGSRDTAYPVDPEPRIVRNMIHYRLNLAFTDAANRQEHLGRARYWQDKWTSAYAQDAEAIRTYDIREGVARYLERAGDYADPALSGEELTKAQTAGLEYQYDTSIDGESYSLGFVSGLLLDLSAPGWKDTFYASGKTLVELLLEQVSPVQDEEDSRMRERVTTLIAEENERVKADIAVIDEAEADTSTAYLRTEGEAAVNLSHSGTYSYKGKAVFVQAVTEMKAAGGGSVKISSQPIVSYPDTGQYVITLPSGSYTYKDGTLTITGDKVSGEVKATESTDNGRTVFTMKLATS